MKVIEKAADRRAEVHIHVEGRVDALEEYGEYIDATDKAICCYVPVEEGHRVRVYGNFNGTTLVIAYDVIVDGILRKASSYTAKSVYLQRNKKIDAQKFLYKTGQDVIDTDMLVAPLAGLTATLGEGKETIGTMELRLYVTRQLGVTHAPGRFEKYASISGNVEDDEIPRSATYKLIAPTCQMVFDKNVATLDKGDVKREHRKMDAKRPGTEPWAIFRFHYRSKEAITEHKLDQTYHPRFKHKSEPYTLNLEPVPPLPVGIKPQKDDGTSSTHTSSPTPDVPGTPTNALHEGPVAKHPTLFKHQLLKHTTTQNPIPKMASSTTPKGTIKTPDMTVGLEVLGDVCEDRPNRMFTKTSPAPKKTFFTPINEPTTNGDIASVASASTVDGDVDNAADAAKSDMINRDAKDLGGSDMVKKPTEKSSAKSVEQKETVVEKPVEKPTAKEKPLGDTTVINAPKPKTTSTKEVGSIESSSLPQSGANPASGIVKGPATNKAAIPSKRPLVAPAKTVTTTPTTPKRAAPDTPGIPENQVYVGLINGSTCHSKRPKFTPSPLTQTSSTIVPRIPSATPSPRLMSVERKVAEQRKKLEAIRQMRLETAKKQEALDKKMEPYRKRMEEELERLNREMMEEEAAVAEDEEHFKISEEMLKEFETAE